MAVEEPLSQMARAGLGLEGSSVLGKTFPELRVLELQRQWGQVRGSLGVPAAAPVTFRCLTGGRKPGTPDRWFFPL